MGETRTRRSSRSRSTRSSTRSSSSRADTERDDGQAPEKAATRTRRARHSRDSAEVQDPPAADGSEAVPQVRVPAALRVGRRRVVGPLIGAQLARRLLDEHQPDVLLSERCGCGLADPCPARAFFGKFFADEAHSAVMAGAAEPWRVTSAGPSSEAVPAGPSSEAAPAGPSSAAASASAGTSRRRAGAVARPGADAGAPDSGSAAAESSGDTPPADSPKPARASSGGRGTRTGRRPAPRHSSSESEPAADLDATQQIPVVPADPPPVAVAV
ncbi:MAG: hypothetical protein ACRDT6_23960 [Micromonosporaceae bacterium]